MYVFLRSKATFAANYLRTPLPLSYKGAKICIVWLHSALPKWFCSELVCSNLQPFIFYYPQDISSFLLESFHCLRRKSLLQTL